MSCSLLTDLFIDIYLWRIVDIVDIVDIFEVGFDYCFASGGGGGGGVVVISM